MKNFTILITSPFDREKLVAEIWYNKDLLAEINQERGFLEIVFYHGSPEYINLPMDEFMIILQKAEIHLLGNEEQYMKMFQQNKTIIRSTSEAYIEKCRISIVRPLREENSVIAKILYNEKLLAEVKQINGLLEVLFFYNNSNIELPIESLVYLLQKTKKLFVDCRGKYSRK